ncbi:metallophosphoesterase (TIGR03767 family) [Arthrobacter pascens]|uniref:hypothetical protein n=1 Tax=Arthrobacter pascens TaxID=1677 RepID=UPI0027880314|nr:hypothetical protein [Arthrobacter pascens]MDQ0633540.1 metallophosphoesterase (TIGR03767 family) [Arthrobacter pascens]
MKPQACVVPATTLDGAVVLGSRRVPDLPYRQLALGPALTMQVREELGPRSSAPRDSRKGLAAFGHLTDSHVLDAANPGRLSFLWQYFDFDFSEGFPISGLFRPQDLLTVHVLDATVRKLNAVARGPICQRPLDCLVMTGDLTNSFALTELSAGIGVFEGKSVTAHPGSTYEGLQDHGPAPLELSRRIWHPEPEPSLTAPDEWKALYGYPSVPGLLQAAIKPVTAEGSRFPWFVGVGNHDEAGRSTTETISAKTRFIDTLRVGDRLPIQLPPRMDEQDFWENVNHSSDSGRKSLIASMPSRKVTPSSLRREFSKADIMNSLENRGHDDEMRRSSPSLENHAYYTFDLSPLVIGIMLNTASPDGGGVAVMDATQAEWLEEQLKAVTSRSYDSKGRLTTTKVVDRLVVLFSHHPLADFEENTESYHGGERRLNRSAVQGLISRFPNVVAWMNGHIHKHRVTPHATKYDRGGFWEITTASLIDYPQQSRIVELLDNGDGTLSIVATLVDHSSPESVLYERHSPQSMAALSLEIVTNYPGLDHDEVVGSLEDQNVDLIVRSPF